MHTSPDAKLVKELEQAGLSEKEAMIYAVLLDMGGGYPSRIAEQTRLNRSTVYKILLGLSIKGLVTEIEKSKKQFYQIERPQRLLRLAQTRKETAADEYEKARKLIPEIENIYSLSPNKPRVRFFENKSGLQSIFEDHVNVSKSYEMLGFANTSELERFMTTDFLRRYVKKKERLNITTRGIVPDTAADKSFNDRVYRGIKPSVRLDLRYIPKNEFPFNGEITIYGEDRVSIINFNDRQLVGVIIQDKAIHEMMVRIFELAWKGAAK